MAFYAAFLMIAVNHVRGTYGTAYPFNPVLKPDECYGLQADSIESKPQTTTGRFSILVSDNIYSDNDVKVTIKRNQDNPIKGLILQARRANCAHKDQVTPLGRFNIAGASGLMLANCSGSFNTVINRDWAELYNDLVVHWSNAGQSFDRIYFTATIYSASNLYWKDVTSEIIRHYTVQGDGGEICPAVPPLADNSKGHADLQFLALSLFFWCLLSSIFLIS